MRKEFLTKHLLQQNVQMDGNVNFMVNGDINIQPCPWEQDVDLTDGRPVHYLANLEVMADGQTIQLEVPPGNTMVFIRKPGPPAYPVVKMATF